MKNMAVLLASGAGTRMGGDISKPFAALGGAPVWVHAARTLLQFTETLLLAVPPGLESLACQQAQDHNLTVEILPGGACRNDSLQACARHARSLPGVDNNTRLITHDAARPLVTAQAVAAHIALAQINPQAIATSALPAVDTLLLAPDGQRVQAVPSREQYYRAQTPQSFPLAAWEQAYDALTPQQREQATDVTALFLLAGPILGCAYEILLLPGDERAAKLTVPADWAVIKSFMKQDQGL